MFENYQDPTEYDYELVKLIYQYMRPNERIDFSRNIAELFSDNDLMATKELAKTIITVRSNMDMFPTID